MIDEIHQRIEYIRKKAGMSQSEVAKVLGMTRTSYVYAEKYAQTISPDFINKFAKYFRVPTYVLLNGVDENILPRFEEPHGEYYTKTSDTFITTNKEQKLIEMFRMLTVQQRSEIFNTVKDIYTARKVKDR